MFLHEGEKEGEQYKSQGALAVGSRRYTGELMPSTLCHGGTGDIFSWREKESNREQTTFFIEREVFGKTINNKRNSLFFGQTSEQEEERVFSSCQQILILWNQERKVN